MILFSSIDRFHNSANLFNKQPLPIADIHLIVTSEN
jgi:hypothetical protein